ncbi:MAG: phasin family protein, partial [Hyphomicrobiaceae bacterium]
MLQRNNKRGPTDAGSCRYGYVASAPKRNQDDTIMMKNFDEVQKASQKTMDATVRSFGEMNKGLQTLATEMTDYTKKSFEDG